MKFGPILLQDALGATLAHRADLRGGPLRKGHVLGATDLARMAAEGWQDVIVARLEAGDVPEDAAASALASALVPDPAGQGLRLTPATTGRVNIYATGPGVFVAGTAAITALNAVDPMITLATLRPFQRVEAGMMVATAKIIAYAVPDAALALACHTAEGALRVAAPVIASASLIETALHGETPATKGREAMAARLRRLGVTLGPRRIVPHHTAALADALAAASAEAVFILTASATSDENDVGPAALLRAGGTLTRFGMPVDPGNLLFIGQLGETPVIGLPGCARSPALNGADWVLERVICGVPVTAGDIAAMGVGGLLKESPARGRLREAE